MSPLPLSSTLPAAGGLAVPLICTVPLLCYNTALCGCGQYGAFCPFVCFSQLQREGNLSQAFGALKCKCILDLELKSQFFLQLSIGFPCFPISNMPRLPGQLISLFKITSLCSLAAGCRKAKMGVESAEISNIEVR